MRSRCATTPATSSLSPAAPCPPRPSQSPACPGRATYTAPPIRVAGGIAPLEEVRCSKPAGVRVAVIGLQRVQHRQGDKEVCVWMCVPRTQRLSSPEEAIVAPSVTRHHTPSNARTRRGKNRGQRRMTPRAGSTFTHGGHRAAASAGHKLNAKGVPHTYASDGTVIPTADTRSKEVKTGAEHVKGRTNKNSTAEVHGRNKKTAQAHNIALQTKQRQFIKKFNKNKLNKNSSSPFHTSHFGKKKKKK
ncbi:hypothetical protein TcCL_Unassigned02520, partial [Trypanosoma cruzi]